jgi:hypothetical protein
MKVLKVFLFVIVGLLLIAGSYSKIANTDFGYWDADDIHVTTTSIILTGNEILFAAIILTIPLIVILKKKKDNR